MTAWRQFSRYCNLLGLDAEEEFRNIIDVLRQRHLLRLIPNDRLRDAQVEQYMAYVLGRAPNAEEVGVARVTASRVSWPAGLRETLARRQGFRCPVCGALVATQMRDAHIDHVRAISLGGTNDPVNLRLLCPSCNMGKSDLFDWRLGVPWNGGLRVGARLRYCVLMHSRSHCQEPGCAVSSANTLLLVVPRVPISRGGRLMFDNLVVRCEAHAAGSTGVRRRRPDIAVPGRSRKVAVKPLRSV